MVGALAARFRKRSTHREEYASTVVAASAPERPAICATGEDPMSEAPRKLTGEEIRLALSQLVGWEIAAGKLHREYQFRDFIEAWGFMSSAALVVQQMDHHPEWSNVYHTVRIDLMTHSAGGLTRNDIELAKKIEAIAARHLKPVG